MNGQIEIACDEAVAFKDVVRSSSKFTAAVSVHYF